MANSPPCRTEVSQRWSRWQSWSTNWQGDVLAHGFEKIQPLGWKFCDGFTSWNMNFMQLPNNSQFFVTSWTHKFKLLAKQWTYRQCSASFFTRALTPFRTPLVFAAPSYAWPMQLAIGREHLTSTSFMTSNKGEWFCVGQPDQTKCCFMDIVSLSPPNELQCTSARCARCQLLR